MNFAQKNCSHEPRQQRKGFTLAEVMIAAAITVVALIGLLGTTILSYKYALRARYEERATNALMTIADQFQNSPVRDHASGNYKTLFQDTSSAETGTGMAWDSEHQCFIYPSATYPEGTAAQGLLVSLTTVGDATASPLFAKVTRIVQDNYGDKYPEAGTPVNSTVKMVEATFIAEYPYSADGQKLTSFLGDRIIRIKALRTINKTDLLQ